jgi:hypothetical protein
LTSSATNYDAASAQARLLSVSGIATDSTFAGPPATPAAPRSQSAYSTSTGGSTESRTSPQESESQELERCVATVSSTTQEQLIPLQFEAATFDGRSAFLLFFRTQDRYELWVVARPACEVLYFAQAG